MRTHYIPLHALTVTALLSLVYSVCCGQTTETWYFSNQSMSKEVSPKKAKFSKTVTQGADGTITTSHKDLMKGNVIWSETLKGDEPYGVWIYQRASETRELNYDFQLIYSPDACPTEGTPDKINNYFQDNDARGYKAPRIGPDNIHIYKFVGNTIIYPAYARRRGIEGAVNTSFTIKEDGSIESIVVTKGVNIHLDKEAVRVLRELKFSSPPTLNGQPTSICVNMPIIFKLG